MKYYIKKISKQDKTRTFVINKMALKKYFNISLDNRNDATFIHIQYPNTKSLNKIKLVMKQDIRLFINRKFFNINDLIIFKKCTDLVQKNIFFKISIISIQNKNYSKFIALMKNNYLLTDSIDNNGLQNNDKTNDIIKVSISVKKN
tara:strand:+ start:273 stop:710 length:438 start_codon:yes stop_codon:yes gene_type:complete